MGTTVYNNAETHSLTKLLPGNSSTMGGVTTSSTGNTLKQLVGPIGQKGSSFSPPGSDWEGDRTGGVGPRMVVWDWRIMCDSLADVLAIERFIEAYIRDGREYVLNTGETAAGREGDYVKLQQRGTGPVGRPLSPPDGRRGRRWRLTFKVLWPQTAVDKL